MMLFILLAVGLLGLAADLYIGFRYFRQGRRGLRILYFVQAGVVDVVLPLVFSYVITRWGHDGSGAQVMLWLMWCMILSFVVKVPLAVFLLLNDGLNRLLGRRWHLFEIVGGAVAVIVAGLMVYGVVHGVSAVRVNRVVIVSPKIPEVFDGYRIAQFSDLHIGNLSRSGGLLGRMIDTVLAQKPDLIINSGDLVNIRSSEITPEVFAALGRLQAPDGVVSVLGNHDLGIYIPEGAGDAQLSLDRLRELQRGLGWRLLQNENVALGRGNDTIFIAGVDFPHNGRHNGMRRVEVESDLAAAMRGIDTSRFSVLAAHSPSIWDSIPAVAAPDLTVSGHIHAMQLKFSLGRWHFSPAEWVYPEWSGLYVRDGRRLYVNDGIGYVLYPMRIGAPAEVTLYEFRRSAE